MAYPDQLEIVPRDSPVAAVVRPPGSKSITNRALVIAALAGGVSRLSGPLEADDTVAMRSGLRKFGVGIDDNDDPWLVAGTGGKLQAPEDPIDARLSGTTARFLTATAALAPGRTTITGRGHLRRRPMRELLDAMIRLGVSIESEDGHLPVTVTGAGQLTADRIEVDPSRSSQFVTALLIIAPMGKAPISVRLTRPAVSRPYVDTTVEVMTEFGADVQTTEWGFVVQPTGYRKAHLEIEADASAAVYPLVAAAISGGRVVVSGIPAASLQSDLALLDVLVEMGCIVERHPSSIELTGPDSLAPIDVDLNHAPDAVLVLAVACLFATGKSRIRNVGNLRLKETDRLAAISTELKRVGGLAEVEGDDLIVGPGRLQPAIVRTYDDHRMAMSMALVGLRQPGIVIDDPNCVGKTWPGYFETLASL
ncbi:MAG TPA: 3-phosphoshikimate 1-carboxyvinyltransferase [Acidimicrobiia bacterium]|jgi:3-phosphoshikimate 1-carboxyvinyltransferase